MNMKLWSIILLVLLGYASCEILHGYSSLSCGGTSLYNYEIDLKCSAYPSVPCIPSCDKLTSCSGKPSKEFFQCIGCSTLGSIAYTKTGSGGVILQFTSQDCSGGGLPLARYPEDNKFSCNNVTLCSASRTQVMKNSVPTLGFILAALL